MNETAQDVRAVDPESTWAEQRCPFCHGICALVPAVTSAPAHAQLRSIQAHHTHSSSQSQLQNVTLSTHT